VSLTIQPAAGSPAGNSAGPLRLAIAAPRFWPLLGDAERRALRLAEGLIELGHQVTVVTPRWRRAWPAEMCVGIVPLVRLRGSHRTGWSTLRWMYALSRWLKEQAASLDAILACGLRHEAYVAVGAARERQLPVIAIAGAGDIAWQRSAAFGSRIAQRCRLVDAIVAQSGAVADELAAAGFAQSRIKQIPWSVDLPPPRSPLRRAAGREALATVNSDLITTDATPIGLAAGRLDAEHRFGDLIRAWRIVTANRPEARLWIVGDGPERERLFRQICDLDLRHRVLLPGTFDFLDELLDAADLFIQPGTFTAPPLVLEMALAAGLPVAAADSPAIREALEPGRTGLVFTAGDVKGLASLIERTLADPAEGITLGSAARDAIRSGPHPDQMLEQYTDLLTQLVHSS
jgi:glycosyltransferase involved in cell wall biosynthesis